MYNMYTLYIYINMVIYREQFIESNIYRSLEVPSH